MIDCLTCANWKPRESGAMVKHGYAICAMKPPYKFFSHGHKCVRHSPASEEVAAKRRKHYGNR